MAAAANGSFASPVVDAHYAATLDAESGGLLNQLYNGVNGWSFSVTLFLILVAYDQCQYINTFSQTYDFENGVC